MAGEVKPLRCAHREFSYKSSGEKKIENRSTFAKVIIKHQIAYFLEHGVYTLRYSDRFSVCVSVHVSLMRLSSFITPEGSKISHKNTKIHKITHTKYDTKLHISTHSKTIKNTKRTLYQTGM